MRKFIVFGGLLSLLLISTGCNFGRNAAEKAVEQVVEKESGQTVSYNEDGSIVVELADGSTKSINEDGSIAVESADGSTKSINEDGSYEVDSEAVTVSGSEDGSLKAEIEDGSMEFGTSSELPEGWPEDVPLPDGITISGSVTQGENLMSISFTSTEKVEKLQTFFKERLTQEGWTEKATISSGSLYGYTAEKDGRTVSISLNSEPDSEEVSGSIAVGSDL